MPPIKLTSTNKTNIENGVKFLVYGPTGAGKTVLCDTAPSPLIISAEKGLLSLQDKDIPVLTIDSFADFKEAYNFVLKSTEAQKFETICVDSLFDIADKLLEQALNKFADGRKAYGEMQLEIAKMIRNFRDIQGKHVYFICPQTLIEDTYSGITRFGPNMPGRVLKEKVPFFLDLIMALRITEQGQRYLQTQACVQYTAKDRSGKLDKIEKPDIKNIITKMQQPKNTTTEKTDSGKK